jgi:hypothetical protein
MHDEMHTNMREYADFYARLVKWGPLLAGITACAPAASDKPVRDTVAASSAIDSAGNLDRPDMALEVGPGVLLFPEPAIPGLLRVDLATGQQDSIGRAGDRPGEFRSPSPLQALAGGRIAAAVRELLCWTP